MKPIKILLVCILIVGIPVVAYAIGVPDRYIQGLFLLMLLIYILPSIRSCNVSGMCSVRA